MRNQPQPGVIVGLTIALALPAANALVAGLWQLGVLDLGLGGAHQPNNSIVQALFSTVGWELLLGPAGIAIAGWSASLRGTVAWTRYLRVAVPGLFAVWLVAAMYLSLVNGTLF